MRTHAADLLTAVILAVFRANGRLLSGGDALARPFGLTSARWQVLGAIALANTALSAPQIGATMGITRQGAQKQLHRLVAAGLIEPEANRTHKRSPRYALTPRGQALYAQVDRAQAGWANQLAEGMAEEDLRTTERILERLAARLDGPPTAAGPSHP